MDMKSAPANHCHREERSDVTIQSAAAWIASLAMTTKDQALC